MEKSRDQKSLQNMIRIKSSKYKTDAKINEQSYLQDHIYSGFGFDP